jgi:hypothetical protein
MEAELEFHAKQEELSEQLEGLNDALKLKQALLKQQTDCVVKKAMLRSRAIASLFACAECLRPEVLLEVPSIPDPLAYYPLNDGEGYLLKEAMSGKPDAGYVVYEEEYQTADYTEPHWPVDERFGKVVQCGKKDSTGEQKQTLQLSDVNYGHGGAWSLSVWFRHEDQNFEDYEREQLIGHGDPLEPTSSSENQFHVQIEKSTKIRTIVFGGSSDTQELPETRKQTSWHQYVFTTRPHHPPTSTSSLVGVPRHWSVYIDGVLEVSSTVVGGSANDPTGPFRLCGREKPASWEDDNAAEDEVVWDAERFFLGRVAHFAVWDHTLSEEQVKALKAAYDQYYTLSMPHSDATSTLARGQPPPAARGPTIRSCCLILL